MNDVGAEIDDSGGDVQLAEQVVAEIQKAGGRTVASTEDVGTAEAGQAITDLALTTFRRVDMLAHNAGIVQATAFGKVKIKDVRRVLDTKVNVVCPIAATRMAREAQKERFGRHGTRISCRRRDPSPEPRPAHQRQVLHAGCSHVAKIFDG